MSFQHRELVEDVVRVMLMNAKPAMVEHCSHARGFGLSKKIPVIVELGSHAGG